MKSSIRNDLVISLLFVLGFVGGWIALRQERASASYYWSSYTYYVGSDGGQKADRQITVNLGNWFACPACTLPMNWIQGYINIVDTGHHQDHMNSMRTSPGYPQLNCSPTCIDYTWNYGNTPDTWTASPWDYYNPTYGYGVTWGVASCVNGFACLSYYSTARVTTTIPWNSNSPYLSDWGVP